MRKNNLGVWNDSLSRYFDFGFSEGYTLGIYFPLSGVPNHYIRVPQEENNSSIRLREHGANSGGELGYLENWGLFDTLMLEMGERNKLIQMDNLYMIARRDLKAPRMKIEVALDNLIKTKKSFPGNSSPRKTCWKTRLGKSSLMPLLQCHVNTRMTSKGTWIWGEYHRVALEEVAGFWTCKRNHL